MPEVREVFRMATQKVKPDPGAMERQFRGQRRRTTRRKAGVYGLVAALAIGAAIVAANFIPADTSRVPRGQPSGSTTVPGAFGPVGTVTFDGSTCSMELTADRIEPGFVVFDAVNTSDRKVMFDTWELVNGYTYQEFATAIERLRQREEKGKEGPFPEGEPGPNQQVRYLGRGEVIQANSSASISASMSAGTHAIVCLKPYEGLGLRPTGITDPIAVR